MLSSGTGHNFTCARTVIFAELDWNPSTHLQCEDRVHRIGQNEECSIQYLLAEGTTDTLVWPLLQEKMTVSQAVLDNLHHHDATSCTLDSTSAKQNIQRAGVPPPKRQSSITIYLKPRANEPGDAEDSSAIVVEDCQADPSLQPLNGQRLGRPIGEVRSLPERTHSREIAQRALESQGLDSITSKEPTPAVLTEASPSVATPFAFQRTKVSLSMSSACPSTAQPSPACQLPPETLGASLRPSSCVKRTMLDLGSMPKKREREDEESSTTPPALMQSLVGPKGAANEEKLE
jgi:hypothetical protein